MILSLHHLPSLPKSIESGINRFSTISTRPQTIRQNVVIQSCHTTQACSLEGPYSFVTDTGLYQLTTKSLPASVDQVELTRLLNDHLSEYTEIKSIKVIRDSKGGVCAFVQCKVCPVSSLVLCRRFIYSFAVRLGRRLCVFLSSESTHKSPKAFSRPYPPLRARQSIEDALDLLQVRLVLRSESYSFAN
jgi:hypothetical protein